MAEGFRGLVVDDDAVSQRIVIRALADANVVADAASSGSVARQLCDLNRYDIVVTDLQMPNGNGHSLCVDLLQQYRRPVVIVVTGITDPRLTRDLLLRGVDDVMFKPLDMQLLVAKIQALLARRAAAINPGESGGQLCDTIPSDIDLAGSSATLRRLSAPELESKIAILASLLPISPAAIEVANLTGSNDADTHLIAAEIKRDPGLAAELLRLANSSFYNPKNQNLLNIEDAVVRIGTNRIGELAMATAALTSITKSRLPWMDVGLVWRRSIAAGIAADRLCRQAEPEVNRDGLHLSALMHELGRIALGAVYAEEYKTMVAACERAATSLLDQEVRIFPARQTDVAARLLTMWKVPAAVCQPLKHLSESFYQLEQLPEPLRTKTELVKIAVCLANQVVGAWEPWRLVEIPPAPVLARLNLSGLDELIGQVDSELRQAIKSHRETNSAVTAPGDPNRKPAAVRRLAYFQLASPRFDFLTKVIGSMGVELVSFAPDEIAEADSIVINCLGIPPSRLCKHLRNGPAPQRRLIVTDALRASEFASLGTPIGLPCSYKALSDACRGFARGMFPSTTLTGIHRPNA
jgi:HD-like signal output (HDOD) protein/DNA-binding response OmpR family regulator